MNSAAAFYLALSLLGWGDPRPATIPPFNATLWQDNEPDARMALLRDLPAHLDPTMDRAATRALLGPPDGEFGDEWAYILDAGLAAEIQLLLLQFAGDGGLLSAQRIDSESYTPPSDSLQFDPAAWARGARDPFEPRDSAEWLRRNRFAQLTAAQDLLTPGLTRAEAERLLGPPEATAPDGDAMWRVAIGNLGAEAEFLALDFDQNDQLKATRRLRDDRPEARAGLVVPPPQPLEGVLVTQSEKQLLAGLTPEEYRRIKQLTDMAALYANFRLPLPDGVSPLFWANDGHRDALRQALIAGFLTQEFGPDFAERYITDHEKLDANPVTREAMDLYNGEQGRKLALDNPDAGLVGLVDLVQEAAEAGQLLVLDAEGELAPYDQIAPGHHGMARGARVLDKAG